MASQRREIPDSEDEPMTSSPVNTWDGAADKLFATSRGPLQDAQDALQEQLRIPLPICLAIALKAWMTINMMLH
jgi:hypothetical protein